MDEVIVANPTERITEMYVAAEKTPGIAWADACTLQYLEETIPVLTAKINEIVAYINALP